MGWVKALSLLSTTRSIPLQDGLERTLLKLLPLIYAVFRYTAQRDRTVSCIFRKVRVPGYRG
jgi:hypothetical protein